MIGRFLFIIGTFLVFNVLRTDGASSSTHYCENCCQYYDSERSSRDSHHSHHNHPDFNAETCNGHYSYCRHTHCNTVSSTHHPSHYVKKLVCNKTLAIDAVARSVPKGLPVVSCPHDVTFEPPNAMIYSLCNVTDVYKLGKIKKVMDDCYSVEHYAPVGVLGKEAEQDKPMFGIFVGCEGTGFKMITQTCHNYPYVEHVTVEQHHPGAAPGDFVVYGQNYQY